MSNPEYEALESLVSSEGWRLLSAYIDQEWGAVGFATKVGRTLGDPDLDPKIALMQLQQATVAQREVLKVKAWPTERMRQLKQQEQQALTPSMSRRGPGL